MDNVKAWPVGNASGELALPVLQEVQERSPTSGAGDATPEQELNWFVLLEMFFQSASSSVGTVGFVWATVVLLGGFVSKLNKIEFWFVTVLSFFQAMRVFGGDWNSDQMTLYGLLLPQRATIDHPRAHRLPLYIRIFTNVMIFMETPISPRCTPNWAILFVCGKLFLLLAAITIRFLRLMALLSCVALFATHVTLQSLGRRSTGDDAEDSNMRASLNLFYGLALTQALLSYMVVVFMSSREKLVAELRDCRGLRDLDDELLGLYYSHVRETCRSRGVSFALQATFIRFALESITSATHSVRQAGVETLHVLLMMEAAPSSPAACCYYREKAALKTRDSPEATESLFWMATLASPDEGPKRARAACVIARLAAGLRVSGIPSAIPSLCSLLEASSSEGVVQSRSDDPVSAQTNLQLKGLEILERLSRNGDNLSEICSSDHLMSILTEFISRDQLLTATTSSGFQKASTSLLVLARIAGSVGSRGAMLRQVLIRNVSQMSNVRAILWSIVDGADHRRLRVLAVRTVAGLAFDGDTRDSVAARKMVVPLLDVFCGTSLSLLHGGAGDGDGPNGDEELTLEAGRALEMLTTESKPNCAAILEADHDDYLQALCSMLFHQDWLACRPTLARILANLCACSDPGSHGNLQAFITDNISEVLRRTSETRHDDTTEELETLLGLGLQFAKWTSPRAFAEALGMIGRERYIKKLVMTIAQENQRQGLLRFATEQAIWMMKHEREVRCVTLFRDHDRMKAALLQVQGAATGVEDYRLLSPNGAVLEHEEPLASIVRRALKLIGNQAGSA